VKSLKKLFNTKTKLFIGIFLFLILVTWLVLFFTARDTALALVEPMLWAFLFVAVSWLAIHFGVKAWRKRKRKEFDEGVTAKEGIDDRRREWIQWTDELEKQGIDRYELPFYLLVGEPQSGKSVLLQNSDLHFPFGQNRLSGVGGTRGCDWWFTEEAIILDLAGRLFTHEGGAADRAEYEAFLELLSEFRPLCPANGVLLVVPCDSLMTDDEEQCAVKATKIQTALLTLTTKLEAQLPVYLVLTKGDQVFGFAESVHRLDVERRHEMFGWSRPAEKIDSPFDLREVTDGFDEMVGRARLLRAHMSAGARLPEALPEVDRMIAFPHELEGMRGNLEIYLKRIFTASNITDRVFFRGLYLTSGLQSGVPMAKVCSELFGATGEADNRSLDDLFSKPRAYFIKDLVQTRVFGERGLVRPTQGRVKQSKRASMFGYGFAGVVTLTAIILGAVHLLRDKDADIARIYQEALDRSSECVATPPDQAQLLFHPLHLLADAAQQEEDAAEKAFQDPREEFKRLFCHLFDVQLVPLLKQDALTTIEDRLKSGFSDHDELRKSCDALLELSKQVDFRESEARAKIIALLPGLRSIKKSAANTEPLTLARAFEHRMDWNMGEDTLLLTRARKGEEERLRRLGTQALGEIQNSLVPGAPTQPGGEFGYMLAWSGADRAYRELRKPGIEGNSLALKYCADFSNSMAKLIELEETVGSASSAGRTIKYMDIREKSFALLDLWRYFKSLEKGVEVDELSDQWSAMIAFQEFNVIKFDNHFDKGITLSTVGGQFGASDAGQSAFVAAEAGLRTAQGAFDVGLGGDYDPTEELKEEKGLLAVSDDRLALQPETLELVGLGEAIRKVHKRTLSDIKSGAAARAFGGQISEVKVLFERQIPGVREGIVAVEGEGAVGEGLALKLVTELEDLHNALTLVFADRLQGTAKDDAKAWQKSIEKLLYEHLQATEREKDLAWVPAPTVDGIDPRAWEILGALGEASQLQQVSRGTYAVDTAASKLQSKVFFHLADQVLDEWDGREDEVRETIRITEQLDQLASRISTMPNPTGLDQRRLQDWSDRLDNLLKRHLSDIEASLAEIWEPQLGRGSFQTVLAEAIRTLEDLEDMINQSQEEDMAGLEAVVEDLSKESHVKAWLELPNSDDLILALREWEIPGQASRVRRQSEYETLLDALENVRSVSRLAGGGRALADSYASYFRTPISEKPADNAGIRMVRSVRTQFAKALRNEVRSQYEADLSAMLYGSKYEHLFEVLFYTPGDDDEPRFKDVEKDLNDFFRRNGGGFDKLRQDYSLISSKADFGIESEIYPPQPGEDEEVWAGVHRFLLALRQFMLGDGKSMRNAAITFQLAPDVQTRTVWDLDSNDRAARRAFFWYPLGGKKGDLTKTSFVSDVGELDVSDWSLEAGSSDRKFQLFWSDKPVQREAKSDSNAYRFEIESALGPLLFAWYGEPLDDEPGSARFAVTVKPEGTDLEAPIEIIFENPLPLRPERP